MQKILCIFIVVAVFAQIMAADNTSSDAESEANSSASAMKGLVKEAKDTFGANGKVATDMKKTINDGMNTMKDFFGF